MPPRASLRAQQVAFTKFLREYNYDRPHESLGDKTPDEFIYLTEALCRETIGLEQISDRHYRVFFCDLELGLLDWVTRKLLRNKVLRYRESDQKGGKDG
jgi:hypothetical protein